MSPMLARVPPGKLATAPVIVSMLPRAVIELLLLTCPVMATVWADMLPELLMLVPVMDNAPLDANISPALVMSLKTVIAKLALALKCALSPSVSPSDGVAEELIDKLALGV